MKALRCFRYSTRGIRAFLVDIRLFGKHCEILRDAQAYASLVVCRINPRGFSENRVGTARGIVPIGCNKYMLAGFSLTHRMAVPFCGRLS